jgi:two-component system chemotaxis sensor kinase CheA
VTLNAHDLIKSTRIKSGRGGLGSVLEEDKRQKVILLAEDSIVTRTQEKRILNAAGYDVVTAVDGQDAYNKLATRQFDLVVSDIEMPNINGLSLTEKIRQQVQYKHLPVILVTSLASDEDRRRGMEVGADAYLTKPGFDQTVFLETVRRFA